MSKEYRGYRDLIVYQKSYTAALGMIEPIQPEADALVRVRRSLSTLSADFLLITFQTGIVEHVGTRWWSSNPGIPDGSSIYVTKQKIIPLDTVGMALASKTNSFDMIRDIFALIVPAVTVIGPAAKL